MEAVIDALSDPMLGYSARGRQIYPNRRNILYFLDENKGLDVHRMNGTVYAAPGTSLDELEAALRPKGFYRLNDRCLLNLPQYLRDAKIQENEDESNTLIFAGKTFPFHLSKRSVDNLARAVKAYLQTVM